MTAALFARCVVAAAFGWLAAFGQFQAATIEDQPAPAAGLRFQWETQLGRNDAFTEFRAIAAVARGAVLVGATERDAINAGASSANRLLLWRVDDAGRPTLETEITDPNSAKRTNTASIRDVRPLADGQAMLLVDYEAGKPSIVTVTAEGKQSVSRQVLPSDRSPTLFQIVPGAAGKFLLIGHESLDAIAILVDTTGAVAWEKKQDRGRMELLVDGTPLPEGGFVLVGNSGKYDALRAGPSTLWVGHYDASGNLRSEVTYPGRYGRIARSEAGSFALVYDESDSTAQRIVIKGFDAKLRERWSVPLVTSDASFSDFKIAPLKNGGFVVTGGQNGLPYIAVLDAQGKESGTLRGAAADRAIDVGSYGISLAQDNSLVVASSHIQTQGGQKVQQKVRLRKVAM